MEVGGEISRCALRHARHNICPSGKPPVLRSSLIIAYKNQKSNALVVYVHHVYSKVLYILSPDVAIV